MKRSMCRAHRGISLVEVLVAMVILLVGIYSLVRLFPSGLTLASMAASVLFLSLALRTLPVGTAYAVWTGIGATGTAALGIYLFEEPATAMRLVCIGLIVAGIVGLKLAT